MNKDLSSKAKKGIIKQEARMEFGYIGKIDK